MGGLADLASSLLDALYPYNRTPQLGWLSRALGRCVLCKATGATDLLCHACEEDLPWRNPQRVSRLLSGLDAFACFNYCFPINSLILLN